MASASFLLILPIKWIARNMKKAMMKKSGFGHVDYHNLTGGVVALHVGIKC